MIRYYARTNGRLTEIQESSTASCWINIAPPFSHEELEDAALQWNIPIDFLTDSLDVDERPRYEREDDVRLIVIQTPILNEIERDNEAIYITVPIGIVMTPTHVLTITAFENPVLDLFLNNKVKNIDPSDQRLFVLRLLEQNVYRFLNCLKKLNLKRNLIEKELYNSSRNQEVKELLSIEKSLVYFVNALKANELLLLKAKRTDFLQIANDEDLADIFEDIVIDTSQATEMANVYTNILGGTMDAYTSIISNNLNIVMKRLTLITIILMVPTLVASFFGMNVKIPFFREDDPYAFFIIMITSALLSGLLAWFFRRKELF